jgi:hypothetical protein
MGDLIPRIKAHDNGGLIQTVDRLDNVNDLQVGKLE